jgi:hypothetical protein
MIDAKDFWRGGARASAPRNRSRQQKINRFRYGRSAADRNESGSSKNFMS